MSDEEKSEPTPADPSSEGEPKAPEGTPAPEKKTPERPPAKAPAKKPIDPEVAEAKAEALRKKKEAAAAAELLKPVWERNPVPPEWEEAEDDPLVAPLRDRFGEAVGTARRFAGELTLEIERERIAEVCSALRGDYGFTYLVDLCGVDFPERDPRFDVVYQLHNFDDNRRIRLRVQTGEETPVPTVSGVWRAANWPEREVWDMFGVSFAGHPDMTRILTWEGFNGHPLRKDFPLEGIDTGAAIYPERYDPAAGPLAGAGTGWVEPKPSEEAGDEE